MSAESKAYFKSGPLKYEIDLYLFAKQIFNQKLTAAKLIDKI